MKNFTITWGPHQMYLKCKGSGSLYWETYLRAKTELGFLMSIASIGFVTLGCDWRVWLGLQSRCQSSYWPAICRGSMGILSKPIPSGTEITRMHHLPPHLCCLSHRTWLGTKMERGHKDRRSHRQSQREAYKQGPWSRVISSTSKQSPKNSRLSPTVLAICHCHSLLLCTHLSLFLPFLPLRKEHEFGKKGTRM